MRWVAFLLFASAVSAAEPITLWPGKAPADPEGLPAERFLEAKPESSPTKRLTDISIPTLTPYIPQKPNGTSCIIAPGGGYNILAWDKEGTEVAEWLQSKGVTAFVLKYRVPRRPGSAKNINNPHALMDVQRAVRIVRALAKEWSLDEKKIGVLGFSAGGHLAASAATRFTQPAYDAIDDTDKVSCRPDFAVLIYPAYLTNLAATELSPEITVTKETPPCFLAHAGNDGVKPENSVLFYLALKRAGVAADLHVYKQGGHGFGMRPTAEPISTWPARCEDWMKVSGLLPTK